MPATVPLDPLPTIPVVKPSPIPVASDSAALSSPTRAREHSLSAAPVAVSSALVTVSSSPALSTQATEEELLTASATVSSITVTVSSMPVTVSTAPVIVSSTPVTVSSSPVTVSSTPVPVSSTPVTVSSTPVTVSSTPVTASSSPVTVSSTPDTVLSTSVTVSSPAPATVSSAVVTESLLVTVSSTPVTVTSTSVTVSSSLTPEEALSSLTRTTEESLTTPAIVSSMLVSISSSSTPIITEALPSTVPATEVLLPSTPAAIASISTEPAIASSPLAPASLSSSTVATPTTIITTTVSSATTVSSICSAALTSVAPPSLTTTVISVTSVPSLMPETITSMTSAVTSTSSLPAAALPSSLNTTESSMTPASISTSPTSDAPTPLPTPSIIASLTSTPTPETSIPPSEAFSATIIQQKDNVQEIKDPVILPPLKSATEDSVEKEYEQAQWQTDISAIATAEPTEEEQKLESKISLSEQDSYAASGVKSIVWDLKSLGTGIPLDDLLTKKNLTAAEIIARIPFPSDVSFMQEEAERGAEMNTIAPGAPSSPFSTLHNVTPELSPVGSPIQRVSPELKNDTTLTTRPSPSTSPSKSLSLSSTPSPRDSPVSKVAKLKSPTDSPIRFYSLEHQGSGRFSLIGLPEVTSPDFTQDASFNPPKSPKILLEDERSNIFEIHAGRPSWSIPQMQESEELKSDGVDAGNELQIENISILNDTVLEISVSGDSETLDSTELISEQESIKLVDMNGAVESHSLLEETEKESIQQEDNKTVVGITDISEESTFLSGYRAALTLHENSEDNTTHTVEHGTSLASADGFAKEITLTTESTLLKVDTLDENKTASPPEPCDPKTEVSVSVSSNQHQEESKYDEDSETIRGALEFLCLIADMKRREKPFEPDTVNQILQSDQPIEDCTSPVTSASSSSVTTAPLPTSSWFSSLSFGVTDDTSMDSTTPITISKDESTITKPSMTEPSTITTPPLSPSSEKASVTASQFLEKLLLTNVLSIEPVSANLDTQIVSLGTEISSPPTISTASSPEHFTSKLSFSLTKSKIESVTQDSDDQHSLVSSEKVVSPVTTAERGTLLNQIILASLEKDISLASEKYLCSETSTFHALDETSRRSSASLPVASDSKIIFAVASAASETQPVTSTSITASLLEKNMKIGSGTSNSEEFISSTVLPDLAEPSLSSSKEVILKDENHTSDVLENVTIVPDATRSTTDSTDVHTQGKHLPKPLTSKPSLEERISAVLGLDVSMTPWLAKCEKSSPAASAAASESLLSLLSSVESSKTLQDRNVEENLVFPLSLKGNHSLPLTAMIEERTPSPSAMLDRELSLSASLEGRLSFFTNAPETEKEGDDVKCSEANEEKDGRSSADIEAEAETDFFNGKDLSSEAIRQRLWRGVKSLSLDADVCVDPDVFCFLIEQSSKHCRRSKDGDRRVMPKRRNSEVALQELVKENTEIIERILRQKSVEGTAWKLGEFPVNTKNEESQTSPREADMRDITMLPFFRSEKRDSIGKHSADSVTKTLTKPAMSDASVVMNSESSEGATSSQEPRTMRVLSPKESKTLTPEKKPGHKAEEKTQTPERKSSLRGEEKSQTPERKQSQKGEERDSASVLSPTRPITFNPFPTRKRQPKEMAVKLGLYSPTKKSPTSPT